MWRLIWVWVPGDHTRTEEKTSGGGTVALVDTFVFAWKTAKAVWWVASNFAVGLYVIAVALYRAARWTVLALWRGYRWYAARPVNRGQRQPIAAITDKPADPESLWSELQKKQEANAR